jgi:hypothetical protein
MVEEGNAFVDCPVSRTREFGYNARQPRRRIDEMICRTNDPTIDRMK